jgi:hypothetical protein
MNKLKKFATSFILFTIFLIVSVSAVSIQTDKEKYDFRETVLINGNGFLPGQEVAIQINNPNNVLLFVTQTTLDQNGNFTTSYLIPESDPIYIIEGIYTLYATSQSGFAQTTFNVTSLLDLTPPTFSGNQTNETKAGEPCEFKLTWDDNKALHPYGRYIFSTNNSGRWVNATSYNFTSTPQTVSNVTILNNTETLVKWKYYASDNSNKWTGSDTYEVYVVTTVPCDLQKVNITPKCSGGSSSECEPEEKIEVNATYSGDCPNPAYIQVNASDTDCYICDQDRDTCGDNICNITGITVTCSGSPCSEEWIIPNVPPGCQNKTINSTHSSLNSNYPCKSGNEKKDEITPTGSFTFYLVTTTSTSTTSTSTTTTVVTTTYYATTTVTQTTTSGELTTNISSVEESGSLTYWIIVIVIIVAVAGIFVWFKYFRRTEESDFERLKQKWSRR